MGRKKADGKGKTGGRQKGTPNKTTRTMREMICMFCEDNYDDFVESYHRILNPKERCEVYLKAQQYVTPRLNAVDVDVNNNNNSFKSELDKMAEEN